VLDLILFIRQNHPELWKKLRNSLMVEQLVNHRTEGYSNCYPDMEASTVSHRTKNCGLVETDDASENELALVRQLPGLEGPKSLTEESTCHIIESSENNYNGDTDISKLFESDSNPASEQIPEEVPRLQTTIINILFAMIEGKNQLPYDYEQHLRKLVLVQKVDMAQVRNPDGLSLLHAAAVNNKPLFIIPLFRSGCFKCLRPLKVKEGKGYLYEGKTADEICTTLKLRKVQKEIDTFTVWEKSMNLIHIAARSGSIHEVKRMMEFSQDLHAELDDMECSTLYWAVIGGNVEVFQLLLAMKVDHLILNCRKETLLHACCMLGHSHLIESLVCLEIDLTAKDCAKKTALLRVSENGDKKTLAKLMETGMRKELLGPMLAIAGHYGRIGFIKYVVEKYEINPQSKDEAGKSAFLRAGEQGQLDVLKYMFTKSLNFEEIDVRRRNILHLAADGADEAVVEYLLSELKKKGINVATLINSKDRYIGGELCMLIRGKDKGRDSWHYVEVVRALFDIFMKRTRGGTIDVAKFGTLLNSGWGADPDDGAAREIEKRFETRRNAKNVEDLDMTPLHIAAFKDKLDVAKLLVENATDLNIHDKFGLTPLHIAAMRGNMDLVKLLISKGANPEMLDSLVKKPADVAEDNEHREVSNYLKGLYFMPLSEVGKLLNKLLFQFCIYNVIHTILTLS